MKFAWPVDPMPMPFKVFENLYKQKAGELGANVPKAEQIRKRYEGYLKAVDLAESDGQLLFRKRGDEAVFDFQPVRKDGQT